MEATACAHSADTIWYEEREVVSTEGEQAVVRGLSNGEFSDDPEWS